MIKWAIGLSVAFVLGMTGFKLLPIYIDNLTVKQIAKDTVSNDTLRSSPKREVIGHLNKQFAEKNIEHLDPKEVVKVARDTNGNLVLDVKYEERKKLMYNLEIVAGFDEQFTY